LIPSFVFATLTPASYKSIYTEIKKKKGHFAMGKYETHAICCSYTHTTRRRVKENKEQKL
jgi:hypothetical protein